MGINEVVPERLAELFHRYNSALRPQTGDPDGNSCGTWKEIPPQEKSRLVSAARLALLELESTAQSTIKTRQYFAVAGGRSGVVDSATTPSL